MAGDPFGLLLRQRIVFFGGEARAGLLLQWGSLRTFAASLSHTCTVCDKPCSSGRHDRQRSCAMHLHAPQPGLPPTPACR